MKEYQPGQKKKSLTLQSNTSQRVLVLVLFYLGFFFGFSKIVNVFFKPASKKKRMQGKLQRFKQKKKHLVWRDAQWLGVLTALPKDQGSDPSTYTGWLGDQEL